MAYGQWIAFDVRREVCNVFIKCEVSLEYVADDVVCRGWPVWQRDREFFVVQEEELVDDGLGGDEVGESRGQVGVSSWTGRLSNTGGGARCGWILRSGDDHDVTCGGFTPNIDVR